MSKPVNDKSGETPQPAAAPRPTAEVFSMQSLRAIGQGLRGLYGAVVNEAVPDTFIDILKDIDDRNDTPDSQAPATKSAEKTSAKIYVLGAQVSKGRPTGGNSSEGGE